MQPVVLITRPEAEAQRLAEDIAARASNVRFVISPLQEVLFDVAALEEIARRDVDSALIFTSRNGVRAWRGGGAACLLRGQCDGRPRPRRWS